LKAKSIKKIIKMKIFFWKNKKAALSRFVLVSF